MKPYFVISDLTEEMEDTINFVQSTAIAHGTNILEVLKCTTNIAIEWFRTNFPDGTTSVGDTFKLEGYVAEQLPLVLPDFPDIVIPQVMSLGIKEAALAALEVNMTVEAVYVEGHIAFEGHIEEAAEAE